MALKVKDPNRVPIPRKLNSGMIEALSLAIAKGNYAVTACRLCGIQEHTFYDWIKQGEEDILAGRETLYNQLLQSLKTAEAQAETERVDRINAAGVGGGVSKRRVTTFKDGTETVEETFNMPQWLADMTHLERRHPDRWGRRERRSIEVTEIKKIEITHIETVKDYGQNQVVEAEEYKLIEDKGGRA